MTDEEYVVATDFDSVSQVCCHPRDEGITLRSNWHNLTCRLFPWSQKSLGRTIATKSKGGQPMGFRFLAFATVSLLAMPVSVWSQSGGQSAPTFTRDVMPILQAHCQTCHRPGEVAPMSLMTFEEV